MACGALDSHTQRPRNRTKELHHPTRPLDQDHPRGKKLDALYFYSYHPIRYCGRAIRRRGARPRATAATHTQTATHSHTQNHRFSRSHSAHSEHA